MNTSFLTSSATISRTRWGDRTLSEGNIACLPVSTRVLRLARGGAMPCPASSQARSIATASTTRPKTLVLILKIIVSGRRGGTRKGPFNRSFMTSWTQPPMALIRSPLVWVLSIRHSFRRLTKTFSQRPRFFHFPASLEFSRVSIRVSMISF